MTESDTYILYFKDLTCFEYLNTANFVRDTKFVLNFFFFFSFFFPSSVSKHTIFGLDEQVVVSLDYRWQKDRGGPVCWIYESITFVVFPGGNFDLTRERRLACPPKICGHTPTSRTLVLSPVIW